MLPKGHAGLLMNYVDDENFRKMMKCVKNSNVTRSLKGASVDASENVES